MKKGVITIYLTITFTVLLSMFFSAFEAARISAYRVVAESAFQNAVISGFGEYHKELLSQYDLFFVDLTYQTGQVSQNALADHVSQYLNENLSVPEKRLLYARDFFGDADTEVKVSSERRATDLLGSPFKYQATEYMKDTLSADFVSDFLSLIRVKNDYSLDEESFDSIKARISEAEEAAKEEVSGDSTNNVTEEADPETQEVEEEITTIRSYQNYDMEYRYYKPLELLVLKKEAANKSGKMFNPLDVPSGRISGYRVGDLELIQVDRGGTNEIFFTEYIMRKCGNYTREREEGFLCYEAEYIIAGRDNDSENLGSVMEKIFLIRTAANMISLKQDKEKWELIETVSDVLSAITEVPAAVIEVLILCMWAGAESVYDLQDLLNGEKVELIKDADDFKVSLNGGIKSLAALNVSENLRLEDHSSSGTALSVDSYSGTGTALSTEIGSYSAAGNKFSIRIKLSYEDYLRILMYTVPSEIKTLRMMDVVELSIRQTKNNETFRMDYCVDAAVFEVAIHTSFSAEYNLKRKYSYF